MLKKQLLLGGVVVAMAVALSSNASAQFRSDRAIYFTFSAPVSVPNATLPAGKYLFRLADSMVNRSIVQIYSADGMKLHVMTMTLPQIRPQASDEPELRFLETPSGQPPAVATYWYPGERTGWEFIYPREQARRLAQATKTNVLTTAKEVPASEMGEGDLVRISPSGETTPAVAGGEAPAFSESARTTRGEAATDAPDFAARSSAATSGRAAERQSLPATASPIPGMTAAGVLALIAAFALGRRRRHA